MAFVGAAGTPGGLSDVTVLGDVPNTTARLSSSAAAGEILAGEAAARASGPPLDADAQRALRLKGKQDPLSVRVL